MSYWILFIAITLASWLVQLNLKRKFKKYSQILSYGGLTGCEIAEKMLYENGITDVKVTCAEGFLTDHYNPLTKTVNLSEAVYSSNSVMAAAVAAHECGHAVQHARAYAPLTLRSKLVPIVNFSSGIMHWVLIAGLLMLSSTNNPIVLYIGIILFATTTFFAFVTLPVEFNASQRALEWLEKSGMTEGETHGYAKDALKAAASTYVVAAISSLATLVYYILRAQGRD